MALIKCSNCGREISDKAVACPQCGCRVAKPGSGSELFRKAGGVVRLLLMELRAVCTATAAQTARFIMCLLGVFKAWRVRCNSRRIETGVVGKQPREWRRIGIGYGVVILALYILILIESNPSPKSSFDPKAHAETMARDAENAAYEAKRTEDIQRTKEMLFGGPREKAEADRVVQEWRNKQQQQQQDLDRLLHTCPRCGGAGYYSYVDANGQLQGGPCPSCGGKGRR